MARVAPIALADSIVGTFSLAVDVAALTHGDSVACLSAGAFASILRCVMEGVSLQYAVKQATTLLRPYSGYEAVWHAVQHAVCLAGLSGKSPDPEDCAEVVKSMGDSRLAHRALAIAVYCAMVYEDNLAAGVALAANHSGNSLIIASMVGNLLGARLGRGAIPENWLEHLELREAIDELACELTKQFADTDHWMSRHPGWRC